MDEEPVRIFIIKYERSTHRKVLLTTDTYMHSVRAFELYERRWGIEVIFKECRGYLGIWKNRIYGENFNGFWFYNTEVIQLPSKENINEPHANIYPSWPCEMIQPEQRSEQKPKPWEKEAIPLPHHITAKRDTYHKGTCPVFNCNNCNVTAGSGKETDQK